MDPHFDEVAAIADRRPAPTNSPSDGVRLLDRLARLFGAPPEDKRQSDDSVFRWGPLEVRHLLGRGSFGEVYAAWDPTLHREVALKLREPEVGTLRWLDEARNLARVRHPNVLTVHGADVLDGRAGIWTERIEGQTLEEILAGDGPLAEAEVVRIGRDLSSALAAVHDAGLVHGDVKTSNIMLEAGAAPRRAVLVDFGSADKPVGDDIPAYTIGTPLTMAPEVLDGRAASASSDVYGLGTTLFRLLTGRYPVEAESIDELKRAHASKRRLVLRATAPTVSSRLARVVERALEPDPLDRWPNAHVFRRALDDVADPARRIRVRAAAVGGGVVALAAIAAIVFLATRPGPGPISRGKLTSPLMPDLYRGSWQHAGTSHFGFGWTAATPDLDGDGRSELIAAESTWKDASGALRGRTLVFQGTANGPDSTQRIAWVGDREDEYAGAQLSSAGDVNGDGFDDLLVAIRPRLDRPARVKLFPGSQSGVRAEPSWSLE
ncbi:MAG TPA: protein kinase, partial [Candidatus Krumholzibacteria bacterium]